MTKKKNLLKPNAALAHEVGTAETPSDGDSRGMTRRLWRSGSKPKGFSLGGAFIFLFFLTPFGKLCLKRIQPTSLGFYWFLMISSGLLMVG